MRAELVGDCLDMAVAARGGNEKVKGTIFHADLGSKFTSGDVGEKCVEVGLQQSVGRTGVCWDNACSERFWSVFQHEFYYRRNFATLTELYAAIDRWMVYYNTWRRHYSNGQRSPIAYENVKPLAVKAA